MPVIEEDEVDMPGVDQPIPVKRIGRISKEIGYGMTPHALRVIAVEHGIPLIRQGSCVYCPIEHADNLKRIGKEHLRKDERIFGPRRPAENVKMLAPRVIHVLSKPQEPANIPREDQ